MLFELWCWWRLLSPLHCKEIQPIHPKGDQSWIFIGRADAEAETTVFWSHDFGKERSHLKRPWCWKRLRAGEGDDRGWDGWMASRTQWTWVWVNARSWWWPGRPSALQSMRLQRVGHDWATELNWVYIYICQSQSPNSSHPVSPLGIYPFVCSLRLCLRELLQLPCLTPGIPFQVPRLLPL